MYPTTRVFLRDNNGDKFFGEGPCRLLKGIERTGSLRAAAQEMKMAYTKAMQLLKHAEEVLGFPLTERAIGGKGGGGSRLTPQAKEFIRKYETYRDACYQANRTLYEQIFEKNAETASSPACVLSPTNSTSPAGSPSLTDSPSLAGNPSPAGSPSLACVLMASGLGQRFGGNKLLADFCGRPLIHQILDATDTDLFSRRIVVTRHAVVTKLCGSLGIPTVLHSLPYRSDTIRLGLEALEKEQPDGCMFCACDQPLLSKDTIEKMIRAFIKQPDYIYRLTFDGVPGNPIIFPKKYFPELKNLPQDKGGTWVAKAFPDQITYIEAASDLELKDIDTREDIELLEHIWENEYKGPLQNRFRV